MIPHPVGLSYLPYQLDGIGYARARSAVLFGDEMGLGKTVQAIGVLNCDPRIRRVLVVCPAHLRINWSRELDKWWMWEPFSESYIVSYEGLERLDLGLYHWDAAILDEAHYIKSDDAKRTQRALQIRANRRIALSGTPFLSRPIELWNILRWLRPDMFTAASRKAYAEKYCGRRLAYREFRGKGGKWIRRAYWDESGATNIEELNANLRRTLMIRRLKADVLTDLPPKRRQLIELDGGPQDPVVFDGMYPVDYTPERIAEMEDKLRLLWQETATVRHETGLIKARLALPLIHDALAQSQKLVVWAYHRDVIEYISGALVDYDGVILYGGMTDARKQAAVDRFQGDPACRVFIGQLQAAGTGITLTAASHEVFVEQDWSPGVIDQAEDRCHRHGQRESVLCQHLALAGSLDAKLFRLQEKKRRIVERALN